MRCGNCWGNGWPAPTSDFANHYGYLEKVAVRVAKLEMELSAVVGLTERRGTETAVLIQEYFSEEELNEVCFLLGIEPDELAGDTMTTRPFELVRLAERRGLGGRLRKVLREKRPFLDW